MLSTGAKYTKGMDTAAVAKALRADIKAAQKAGELPRSMKVSVTISRFSMGSSITLTVKSAPVQIHASDFIAHDVQTKGRVFWEGQRYTAQARRLLEKLEALGGEYKRTDSDSQTDYHNTNFFLHVNFDGAMEREDRAILTEYHQALPVSHLRLVG